MQENKMNVRQELTLTSFGNHFNGNCKKILAVELNKVFNSLVDTAEFFGVEPQYIWQVLNEEGNHRIGWWERDENGNRLRRICMVRLTYLAHFEGSLDAMMEYNRESAVKLHKANEKNAKLQAENEQLMKEMSEFRAWKAEKEAKRKAEEKRAKAIASANAKVERKQRIFDRLMDELLEAEEQLNKAIGERDVLLKKGDDE